MANLTEEKKAELRARDWVLNGGTGAEVDKINNLLRMACSQKTADHAAFTKKEN